MTKKLDSTVITDFLSRAIVGAMFTLMSMNLFGDYLRTGHLTGLLLLSSESLVVVFTIVRRRAQAVDRSLSAGALTTLSLIGPALLRAADVPALAPDVLTTFMSSVGLSIVLAGKISLGRSFGLVPANRGVVVEGPYAIVRHPIYTGYLMTHIAFLVAHPTMVNVAVAIAADTALIVRALREERVLGTDAIYQAYCRRVGWHLVPGVF